jgi:hypothetical protein
MPMMTAGIKVFAATALRQMQNLAKYLQFRLPIWPLNNQALRLILDFVNYCFVHCRSPSTNKSLVILTSNSELRKAAPLVAARLT